MSSTVVRDPIHGMIELASNEWRAVDLPIFQRLRSIRQLAMTYLVYPGATHTRFEHSIGVRHVAGILASRPKVGLSEDEQTVVRTAALLHDIGHGPFSHVSEQVIDAASGVHGVHEAVSVYLMRNDPGLQKALGTDLLDAAAAIVGLEGPRSVAGDIVSGPSDADKLDYLLRDSYFAGVKYGEYDLGRIADSIRVIAPDSAQSQLGFDADGVWAVEGLLMARHHMHRQVYGHKTRVATDIMISRALSLGVTEGVLPKDAYRVDVSDETGRPVPVITEEFVSLYLEQTDSRVLEALLAAPSRSNARDLAERLSTRDLLRQTVSLRIDEMENELGAIALSRILDEDVLTRDRIHELEAIVAEGLSVEPHLIAINIDSRTNPTYRQPGGALTRKDIMFQGVEGPPRRLQTESEIFKDYIGLQHTLAYLYTPRLGHDDKLKAKQLFMECLKNV